MTSFEKCVLDLFLAGKDTIDIAAIVNISEAQAYRHLNAALNERWLSARWSARP